MCHPAKLSLCFKRTTSSSDVNPPMLVDTIYSTCRACMIILLIIISSTQTSSSDSCHGMHTKPLSQWYNIKLLIERTCARHVKLLQPPTDYCQWVCWRLSMWHMGLIWQRLLNSVECDMRSPLIKICLKLTEHRLDLAIKSEKNLTAARCEEGNLGLSNDCSLVEKHFQLQPNATLRTLSLTSPLEILHPILLPLGKKKFFLVNQQAV